MIWDERYVHTYLTKSINIFYSMVNTKKHAIQFKALVCHDGIFNLPTMLLQTDDTAGNEDFKGAPYAWNNIAELEKWNPARPDALRNWKTPILIIHSDLDYRCPITEGIAAFNVCQAMGIQSRFVNFPDENHFVLKEENSLQWHREVFRWINHFSGIQRETGIDEYRRN